MDKCREEFETWIIKSNATGRVPNFIMKNENGEYVDRQTTDLWISWKASREIMKAIKLPRLIGNDNAGDIYDAEIYDDAINECKDAITSAGYKVEE